jgi:hypothetical protein
MSSSIWRAEKFTHRISWWFVFHTVFFCLFGTLAFNSFRVSFFSSDVLSEIMRRWPVPCADQANAGLIDRCAVSDLQYRIPGGEAAKNDGVHFTAR